MELSDGLNVRKENGDALVTPRCSAEAAATGQRLGEEQGRRVCADRSALALSWSGQRGSCPLDQSLS